MGTCLYIVIQSLDQWWVDCEGRAFGPFPTQEHAGARGVEIAQKFGDPNRAIEVLSRGPNGLFDILWSSEAAAQDAWANAQAAA